MTWMIWGYPHDLGNLHMVKPSFPDPKSRTPRVTQLHRTVQGVARGQKGPPVVAGRDCWGRLLVTVGL